MSHTPINLLGAHEVRMRLGGKISRQRVYQITNDAKFPLPVATLHQGKVWLSEDIEAWIRRYRPALAAPME